MSAPHCVRMCSSFPGCLPLLPRFTRERPDAYWRYEKKRDGKNSWEGSKTASQIPTLTLSNKKLIWSPYRTICDYWGRNFIVPRWADLFSEPSNKFSWWVSKIKMRDCSENVRKQSHGNKTDTSPSYSSTAFSLAQIAADQSFLMPKY